MAIRLRPLIRVPFLSRGYPLLVTKEKTEEVSHTKTALQKKLSGTDIPSAQYGGRHAVTMLPGGGIGPELMSYVREIFHFSGAPIDFEVIEIDPTTVGSNDLEYAITSIKRNGVALKGNIETKSEDVHEISRNVAIRNELDLYVNVVHCKSYAGIPARHKEIDIILIRQNTDGEYAMLEHESVKGVVESMKVVTLDNAERVARYAFEFARTHNRKKVTTIHKANIMKLSDGLFLEVSNKVAREYPELQHNNMIIDNTCMQLVSQPHQFDVMNMTNLYGTIVSNVICGLIGGAGLLSGRNYGDHADLKDNILTDFEDKKKLIENERHSLELTSDSMEIKPTVTRKLRRRPNEPMPVVEKRRKPATGQLLVYLLEDKDIDNDLKTISRGKPMTPTMSQNGVASLMNSMPGIMMPESNNSFVETRIEDGKLLYERRWFHRGQPVYVKGKDLPKFAATISAIGNEIVWVKKVTDNSRAKINMSHLAKGKVSIKRRAN